MENPTRMDTTTKATRTTKQYQPCRSHQKFNIFTLYSKFCLTASSSSTYAHAYLVTGSKLWDSNCLNAIAWVTKYLQRRTHIAQLFDFTIREVRDLLKLCTDIRQIMLTRGRFICDMYSEVLNAFVGQNWNLWVSVFCTEFVYFTYMLTLLVPFYFQ